MDSGIHGFRDTWKQGYIDTGIHEYIWIHEYRDTGIYRDSWIQDYMDTGIHKYRNKMTQEFRDTRIQN